MGDNSGSEAVMAMSMAKTQGDIITQTLDNLNSPQVGQTGLYIKGVPGQVITRTLNHLDRDESSTRNNAMGDTYNLSKSILSAAYEGKGSIINSSK